MSMTISNSICAWFPVCIGGNTKFSKRNSAISFAVTSTETAGFMVLWFLCPRASEGITCSGSGLKIISSQKVGPQLKVSSDRLMKPGDYFQNSELKKFR